MEGHFCVYKKAALKQEFLGFSRESNDRPMRVEDERQVPLFHMEFLQRSNTSKREKRGLSIKIEL